MADLYVDVIKRPVADVPGSLRAQPVARPPMIDPIQSAAHSLLLAALAGDLSWME